MSTEATPIQLVRHHDWPIRLAQAVEARRSTPFVWGENDCCLFAADVVLACTGTDIAEQWRGAYDSALKASRVLRQAGGLDGLMDGLAARYGMRALPGVTYAQRGDLVLLDVPESPGETDAAMAGPALGVCIGRCVAGMGARGVVFVELLGCRRAWRVG